jgi:hypothetical protein
VGLLLKHQAFRLLPTPTRQELLQLKRCPQALLLSQLLSMAAAVVVATTLLQTLVGLGVVDAL